jgi:FkbM family methyltransferase
MGEEVLTSDERLIWELFDNSTNGFFVEVGAGDPIDLSMTYFLESRGWDGILIEPRPELAEKLKETRKARVWSVACGAPRDRGESELFIFGEFSSLKKHTAFTDIVYTDKVVVPVVTLNEILQAEGNPAIDFLSIDVEGFELNVLQGVDLIKMRPRLIFIEYHVLSLDIHFHLRRNNYRLIKRTGVNNWYVPKDFDYSVDLIDKLKLFRKMYLGTPLRKLQFEIKKHTKHRKFRDQ